MSDPHPLPHPLPTNAPGLTLTVEFYGNPDLTFLPAPGETMWLTFDHDSVAGCGYVKLLPYHPLPSHAPEYHALAAAARSPVKHVYAAVCLPTPRPPPKCRCVKWLTQFITGHIRTKRATPPVPPGEVATKSTMPNSIASDLSVAGQLQASQPQPQPQPPQDAPRSP